MVSKSAKYRERLKITNPQKYEEMLMKARERNKQNREKRKRRWEQEPLTRGILHEIEQLKQKQRERWHRFFTKKKNKDKMATRRSSNSQKSCHEMQKLRTGKRPKDMTVEELREHKRMLKAQSRQQETSMKVVWRKRKDAKYQKEKRALKRKSRIQQMLTSSPQCLGQEQQSTMPPLTPPTASPMKQAEYNLVSSFRKKLADKTPSKFARMMANLVKNSGCKKTDQALHREGLLQNDLHHGQRWRVLKHKFTASRRRLFASIKRKRRKDALSERDQQALRVFFMREDISRALPHKRYSTKHGPGFVMQQTLRAAHKIFLGDHPEVKISYSKFTQLRPKNVRKISSKFLDTCQCVYCVNIRLKVLAANRAVRFAQLDNNMKIEDERGLYKLVLCKKDGNQFPTPRCIQGKCPACSDVRATLTKHYMQIFDANPTVTWSKWNRQSVNKVREPTVQSAPFREMLEELVLDVTCPSKSITFMQHLFTADWQHSQYRLLKKTLKQGQLLLVMDFAENRKSKVQDEIKSAHYNKQQFTLHPVVAFYRGREDTLIRHALNFVTPDVLHDYHAVHHFTKQALQHFTDLEVIHASSEVFIFSDNCAAQYKCRGNFADLTGYRQRVQRVYFGAEHGKGEADGETGIVSKAVEAAVLCRQVDIRNASNFFNWCQTHFTKDTQQSKRQFIYVMPEDIQRHRSISDVEPVRGSRKFHQIMPIAHHIMKSRELACFCTHCQLKDFGACEWMHYVGTWQIHQLKQIASSADNTDEEREELSQPPPSPPQVPRDEFFIRIQQELIHAQKSGFGAFSSCAENCIRRFTDYPLPDPVEMEFIKAGQVDPIAEKQRPAGAAPEGYFSMSTSADGNCLPRALSLAVFGSQDYHQEMRVRITCELAANKANYLKGEFISQGTSLNGLESLDFYHRSGDFYGVPLLETAFECEVLATASPSRDMGMWQLLAASNVLGCTIYSVYPDLGGNSEKLRREVHRPFVPDCTTQRTPVFIQWTSTVQKDVGPMWNANHFVPVCKEKQPSAPFCLNVGDFVDVVFKTSRREVIYKGVIIQPPSNLTMKDGEVFVKYMRQSGKYYVFPDTDDVSMVNFKDIIKCSQPKINGRNQHFF